MVFVTGFPFISNLAVNVSEFTANTLTLPIFSFTFKDSTTPSISAITLFPIKPFTIIKSSGFGAGGGANPESESNPGNPGRVPIVPAPGTGGRFPE